MYTTSRAAAAAAAEEIQEQEEGEEAEEDKEGINLAYLRAPRCSATTPR